MSDITIAEFCDRHSACLEGREWALANCTDMYDVWQTARPDWLIWVATRPGVLDPRTLRLFTCWCVRQVWHLLTDERSRNAVEVAERYARGEASRDELAAASDAAWAAAWAATSDAARAAAWDAARVATWDTQARWLRENARPCFDKPEKEDDGE